MVRKSSLLPTQVPVELISESAAPSCTRSPRIESDGWYTIGTSTPAAGNARASLAGLFDRIEASFKP